MFLIPPRTGDSELDAFLLTISRAVNDNTQPPTEKNEGTGLIIDPVTTLVNRYKYRYLQVRYADDKQGTGFGTATTNKKYWGVFNSQSSTVSNDWSVYTWYPYDPRNDTATIENRNPYYKVLGGRGADIAFGNAAPDNNWLPLPASFVIDLDDLIPPNSIDTADLKDDAVTGPKLADNSVSQAKMTDNSVGTAEIIDLSIVQSKLADGSVTLPKLGTAGVASVDTFLRGDFQWAEVQSGLFLKQTLVEDESRYLTADETAGHHFHPPTDDNPIVLTVQNSALLSLPLGTTFTFINLKNEFYVRSDSDVITILGASPLDAYVFKVGVGGKATMTCVQTGPSGRWVVDGVNIVTSGVVDPGPPGSSPGDFIFLPGAYDTSSTDFSFT